MTETIEFTEMEEKGNVVLENARKVYLLGLGTASYTVSVTTDTVKNARTNVGDFSTKMLERGEKLEKDTRENVNKQRQAREKSIRNTQKRLEKEFSKRMESLLHAMNIPSKNDINSLSTKVTKLNKKVEEMSKPAVQ
ncbi:MAG: phasin family protein [Anaerolineae bacterium]|nr:phasin family protein [Anaerolineae bacterium]